MSSDNSEISLRYAGEQGRATPSESEGSGDRSCVRLLPSDLKRLPTVALLSLLNELNLELNRRLTR